MVYFLKDGGSEVSIWTVVMVGFGGLLVVVILIN